MNSSHLRIASIGIAILGLVTISPVAANPNESNRGCCDTPGDVNNDGFVDLSDLTYYVDYMFHNGPAPVCMAEGDVNGDGQLDISDLTFRICFIGCIPPVCGPEGTSGVHGTRQELL